MTTPPNDKWVAGDAYESYMGRWSRPLARAVVGWLRPEPSANWLDVGCGTGALTSAVCDLANPASVVACDPSEPFVEHARHTCADARASFVVAAADALPRRSGGFDVAVSGLVLNFLPDPGAAVLAMCDRVRRGGTVAAYVWDYADGMEFLRIFWDEVVAADPRAAILDEGQRFPLCRPSALESLFRTTGLDHVEADAVSVQTDFTSFDDYWTPFLQGTGPAPGYVASLDATRRDVLRERLARRLGAESGFHLHARAWAVRGIAP